MAARHSGAGWYHPAHLLEYVVEAGREVEVVQGESVRLRGRLVSVADDGMIVHVERTDRSVARAAVHSVAIQCRRTAKGAVIGMLVGLALAYPNARLQGGGATASWSS